MSVLSLVLGKKTGRLPERRRPAFPMVALAVLFSVMALLPLGFVAAVGIETGWPTIKALVFRPRVAELLSNTLWLTLLAVPISIVLGVAVAWLTERTALAGRQLWSALAVAPLAIPAFVQSYAWVSAVPSLHGLSAGVFLSVLAYYPFIYMPVAAVLRRLDPTLEDVAASLGTPPWKVFFRVVLPQLRLAICGGALLTTACAIPIAWLGVRYPRRLFRLLEGCNYITSSLPGIVTALALVTVTIHYARPVYQTEVTLFLAYLLMFMPRALINLRAGIAQAPVELENVARSLGRSPARALWSVTMRLAAPGAAAGAALVFLGVSNELTATLLLSPLGTRTLSTGFWALTSEIDYVAAAPYAMLMIVISLPLTAVLYVQSKKIAGL
ncbi:MAG: ABC transporter permease subunit [Klebsiella aerogenes]|nr:ABC transporter permease subunit [Klebsiella aerogenes]